MMEVEEEEEEEMELVITNNTTDLHNTHEWPKSHFRMTVIHNRL
jgi:hypothetical protein